MNYLPSELVSLISRYLEPHKPSLVSLASSNSKLYQLVIPTLYERVAVSENRQILSLCRGITSSNSGLGIYVKHLHINSACNPLFDDPPENLTTVAAIFSALNHLANLKELELLHHTDMFVADALESARLLPPFRLTRLKSVSYSGDGFAHFLHSQSSIIRLELIELCCGFSRSSISSVVENMTFLPDLSELSATIQDIIKIAPNRRINKVNVLDVSSEGAAHFPGLISSLCRSSVTEISIGSGIIYPSYGTQRLWDFVVRVTMSELAPRLLFLSLDVMLATDLVSYYYGDLWETRARILASFTSLESIRIGQKQPPNDPRTYIVLEELGRMKQLSSWRSFCSNLKSVEVFGQRLE